jgi:hypothetical protein
MSVLPFFNNFGFLNITTPPVKETRRFKAGAPKTALFKGFRPLLFPVREILRLRLIVSYV